jgi:hypothetical protein
MTLVISKGITLRNQLPADAEADAYIAAVEAADASAGQTGGLEPGVKFAIKNFVLCCKQDGIWDAIKASCILAGARTLNGALIPLVGTAPTNVGGLFVSGDYNRKTGLVGNGSTKYLNSNRAGNADPLNNYHASAFATQRQSGTFGALIASRAVDSAANSSQIIDTGSAASFPDRGNSALERSITATGFLAMSRASSTSVNLRWPFSSETVSQSSIGQVEADWFVFARSNGAFTNARLAFYSIGESLDLALLDTRVTQLMTDLGNAIP